MIEKAVGQAVQTGRLHKALLNIQLHEGNALDQIPGNAVGQHGARLRVILTHDEPHLRGIAPASRAAHALQKAGDSEGRVDMKCPLQPPDIDAQLQRGGRAHAHVGVVVFHLVLGALPVGGGEVSVVDEKAVGLVVDLAVCPQLLADGFAFFPGIGKDQALFAPGMLKDIADPRIGGHRCGVRGLFHGRRLHLDCSVLAGLGRRIIKMLHGEPPHFPAAVELGDDGANSAARGEKAPRLLRMADGRGQADPARMAARHFAETLDQAECLQAPVGPQQGMNLVDDDEAQIAEQGRDLHMLVDHERFQRLRRDLQDAGGLLQKLPLFRLRRIPVPARDGDPLLLAELV